MPEPSSSENRLFARPRSPPPPPPPSSPPAARASANAAQQVRERLVEPPRLLADTSRGPAQAFELLLERGQLIANPAKLITGMGQPAADRQHVGQEREPLPTLAVADRESRIWRNGDRRFRLAIPDLDCRTVTAGNHERPALIDQLRRRGAPPSRATTHVDG